MPDSYTEEQVQQILQKALARKSKSGQNLTRAQVSEIATDLGVSREDFLAAEREWLAQREQNTEREIFDAYKKKKFRDRLVTYVIVNAFLIGINLLTAGTVNWAIYPLLFWGVGVALDGWSTYQTDSPAYDQQFLKWQRQQKRAQLTAQITDKVTSTVEEWLKKSNS